MDLVIIILASAMYAEAKFCEKTKSPLELGEWKAHLKQMDSAAVENKPVTMNEGQVYVYENTFPGYTIRYLNVDNLAVKTCGATATVKRGGIGTSTVLIILKAESYQEIRSVIDIWGTRDGKKKTIKSVLHEDGMLKNMKSLYLLNDLRTLNHNTHFIRPRRSN